jgi:hypothetical protein
MDGRIWLNSSQHSRRIHAAAQELAGTSLSWNTVKECLRSSTPTRRPGGALRPRLLSASLTGNDTTSLSLGKLEPQGRPSTRQRGRHQFAQIPGFARGSRSPSRTNASSSRNCSSLSLFGVATRGSSRASSGSIGPIGPVRSAGPPAERYLPGSPPSAPLGQLALAEPNRQPDYPSHSLLRKVWRNGVVTYDGLGITLGVRYAGALVRIVEVGELVHVSSATSSSAPSPPTEASATRTSASPSTRCLT